MNENTKTIKEICEQYGMGQTALARRFGIPVRTVQDWYSGKSKPAPYVVRMIDELLEGSKKGIYLIYKDDTDDACTIMGYIHGTDETADRYCDELNKDHEYEWEDYTWVKLDELPQIDAEKPQPNMKEKTERPAPPLGYKWEGDKLVIDEPEAAKVREVIEKYQKGRIEVL